MHCCLTLTLVLPVALREYRFWTEYGRVFDNIALLPDVRAVVLASALPKLFSAGIDCQYTPTFLSTSKSNL